MFIINRCFLTSGLNHKWFMLHCLVFKEQPCLLKFAFVWKALLQATRLLYRISFGLSRTFLFFFLVWKEAVPHSASVSNQGTLSCFCAGRYLAATCIILQDSGAFVNTYFSKSVKFFESLPCSIYKAIKNASIARYVIMAIGGGTEIWTPDTAGMNRML